LATGSSRNRERIQRPQIANDLFVEERLKQATDSYVIHLEESARTGRNES
jgi:hypothetical protein